MTENKNLQIGKQERQGQSVRLLKVRNI